MVILLPCQRYHETIILILISYYVYLFIYLLIVIHPLFGKGFADLIGRALSRRIKDVGSISMRIIFFNVYLQVIALLLRTTLLGLKFYFLR